MAEGDRRHGCVLARGRGEWRHHCRNLRVDPELVVKTLHQLQARLQVPRELREDLVLFVSSWELRVGARLTVVVPQVLIAAKEPESIATHRTARFVVKSRYLARSYPLCDWLAGTGSRTGCAVRLEACA